MGLFNRKKKETPKEIEIPVIPHEHTWKDMPWYMEESYNGKEHTASYEIIEPYICITCGERKNVKLESTDWGNISAEDREQYYKDVKKRYRKYLKPRAIVEDMINNIILVKDAKRLEMIEEIRGLPHKNCGTSAEMARNENAENDIGSLIIPKEEEINEMDSR